MFHQDVLELPEIRPTGADRGFLPQMFMNVWFESTTIKSKGALQSNSLNIEDVAKLKVSQAPIIDYYTQSFWRLKDTGEIRIWSLASLFRRKTKKFLEILLTMIVRSTKKPAEQTFASKSKGDILSNRRTLFHNDAELTIKVWHPN